MVEVTIEDIENALDSGDLYLLAHTTTRDDEGIVTRAGHTYQVIDDLGSMWVIEAEANDCGMGAEITIDKDDPDYEIVIDDSLEPDFDF